MEAELKLWDLYAIAAMHSLINGDPRVISTTNERKSLKNAAAEMAEAMVEESMNRGGPVIRIKIGDIIATGEVAPPTTSG